MIQLAITLPTPPADQFLHALVTDSRRQRAVELAPGLLFEVPVEFCRILGETSVVAVIPKLADQARRMPGGAARQALAFEHQQVAHAGLGQVVVNAAADDAAADNDDLRVGCADDNCFCRTERGQYSSQLSVGVLARSG